MSTPASSLGIGIPVLAPLEDLQCPDAPLLAGVQNDASLLSPFPTIAPAHFGGTSRRSHGPLLGTVSEGSAQFSPVSPGGGPPTFFSTGGMTSFHPPPPPPFGIQQRRNVSVTSGPERSFGVPPPPPPPPAFHHGFAPPSTHANSTIFAAAPPPPPPQLWSAPQAQNNNHNGDFRQAPSSTSGYHGQDDMRRESEPHRNRNYSNNSNSQSQSNPLVFQHHLTSQSPASFPCDESCLTRPIPTDLPPHHFTVVPQIRDTLVPPSFSAHIQVPPYDGTTPTAKLTHPVLHPDFDPRSPTDCPYPTVFAHTNQWLLPRFTHKNMKVYQYDVRFPPTVATAAKNQLFYNAMNLSGLLEHVAFDGSSLAFSFHPLPTSNGHTFPVRFDHRQLSIGVNLYYFDGSHRPPQSTSDSVSSDSSLTIATAESSTVEDMTDAKSTIHGTEIVLTAEKLNAASLSNETHKYLRVDSTLASSVDPMASESQPHQRNSLAFTCVPTKFSSITSEESVLEHQAAFSVLLRHVFIYAELKKEEKSTFDCAGVAISHRYGAPGSIDPHSLRIPLESADLSTPVQSRPLKDQHYAHFTCRTFISRNSTVFPLNTPTAIRSLPNGLSAVSGAFLSFRALQSGIVLNCDSVWTRCYTPDQPMIDILTKLVQVGPRLDRSMLRKATQSQFATFIGYKMTTTHMKSTPFSIDGVGPRAGEVKFTLKSGGREYTLPEYYQELYNVDVDPYIMTYKVRRGSHYFTYPIEVLVLHSVGQRVITSVNPAQNREMLSISTILPHHRLDGARRQLEGFITAVQEMKHNVPELVNFCPIPDPATLMGFQLPPPSIIVPQRRGGGIVALNSVVPNGGLFRLPTTFEFLCPASLKQATNSDGSTNVGNVPIKVARFTGGVGHAEQFGAFFDSVIMQGRARNLALEYLPTDLPISRLSLDAYGFDTRPKFEAWLHALSGYAASSNTVILILAVLTPSSDYYSVLKRLGETKFRLVSQCALSATVKKASNTTDLEKCVNTMLLKINAKLGGLNYSLWAELKQNPLLISNVTPQQQVHPTLSGTVPMTVFGIDCWHEVGKRSHAGFVSTFDQALTRYNSCVLQQPLEQRGGMTQTRENIPFNVMREAFFALMSRFAVANGGKFPRYITIFRDGISDAQLTYSLQQEIPGAIAGIQQAYLAAHPMSDLVYEPIIAVMVAVKRHHIRFRPNFSDGDVPTTGPTSNLPPGTVFHSELVHTHIPEFHLQAHRCTVNGTARNTLLQVVWISHPDKIKLIDLELLANYLSYGHQRSTTATRVPTPIYFADLLCYRARLYNPEFETPSSSHIGTWEHEQIHPQLQSSHFYL